MWSVFIKEINTFFSSLIGYIVVGIFLIAMGLFFWVIQGSNVLDYGYASMETLFSFAPIIFIFLIPAITMRTFSEEKQVGTLEILSTKPLTDIKIILGKYLACLVLIGFALLPTLIYYYSIYQLGAPVGNIDTGATIGSYMGLFFLASIFAAIGVFSSSISDNQIVSFVIGAFLCFFCYLGFEFISELPIFVGKLDNILEQIGINYHYTSMSRGLIDTRDVIYVLSAVTLFIYLTMMSLSKRKW